MRMDTDSKKRYANSMKPLPILSPGRILLFLMADAESNLVFELVARLALQNPLYVLDGGNAFRGYELARLLRRQTADYGTVLQQVTLSRIFTCYQMAVLFSNLLADGSFVPQPVLVLDFLVTFYDQGVPVAERRRLLECCITRLRQISRRAPIAVWVRHRSLVPPEGLAFLDRLQTAFGPVWTSERTVFPGWHQPSLLAEEKSIHAK